MFTAVSTKRERRSLFVPGEHPDLDVGQCQEGYGLRNPLLKLVLNGRCAQQHHVALNLLVHAGQPVLPAVLGQAGLEPPVSPLLIVLFVQVLVGQHQGPQPFPCIFIQVVGGAVEQLLGGGVESVQQDRVSPFAVQSDLPLWVSHYDRHPLPDIVEVQDGQQLVGDGCAQLMDSDGLGGTRAEHETEVPGCSDQGPLVRGLGFVVQLPFVLFL